MKFKLLIIFFLLFNTVAFSKILDQAIVIIENDVITQTEYQKKLRFILNQYQLTGSQPPQDMEAFYKQVLENMIQKRLQIQFARKAGLEIKEWMIDKSMENMAKRANLSLIDFREKIIESGVDYSVYRENLKEDLITREIQRRVISQRIKISEKEIDEFIEHQSHVFKENNEYKISLVLVSVKETPSINEKNAAKSKIKMVKEKFLSGENFASLARMYSDSGNALDGGDLGWRKISEVPEIFLSSLENMDKGEISEIIETLNGFYVFFLEDKKEMENVEIEERKVRHILIKTNAIVTNEIAENKLKELKSRINSGESFSDLAKAYSEDTMSAANGGELEWSPPGTFVPQFEDKIDLLPLKEISEPFLTQFGWHILEVLEKRKQDNTEIIKRNLARQYLISGRSREVIDSWIIELKEKNFIKYVTESNKKSSISNNKKSPQQRWDPFSE
jgi:peptidyl-prolyl cis-trans isomerase SurA|tara:strand:+ start:853 stop:2196 length:1344 start_codon:yes stop_codon:yes gene_type:complete